MGGDGFPRPAWQQPDPAFWRGRRVLLTGHTGFKGSWLALWLCELGARVTGFALVPDTAPSLFEQLGLERRLDHQIGDVREPETLKALVAASRPEVVLHLAAQPLVRRSYAEPLATWQTNVMGTIHLMEALRSLERPCAAVLITTDKVYRNNEWLYGYRENDPLGGHDPYSSSKAAAELAIASWRASFCGSLPHQSPHLRLASARAGNVIGGGDWAADRIIPDTVRALQAGEPITLRHPSATRPWQHVLEPLGGYLALSEALADPSRRESMADAFNFGPELEANRPVRQLVEQALVHWPGRWIDASDPTAPHEAGWLNLAVDKAHHRLGWLPRWDFSTTTARTLRWYRRVVEAGDDPLTCCLDDLSTYVACCPPGRAIR
jgi:CDP-glucose 4,6-dehydratase